MKQLRENDGVSQVPRGGLEVGEVKQQREEVGRVT